MRNARLVIPSEVEGSAVYDLRRRVAASEENTTYRGIEPYLGGSQQGMERRRRRSLRFRRPCSFPFATAQGRNERRRPVGMTKLRRKSCPEPIDSLGEFRLE
jgi:hypothetical protein